MPSTRRRGLSLIEVLVVVVFVVILVVVGAVNLVSRRSKVDFDNTVEHIAALLREAQSRSVAQESGAVWGVHFVNSATSSSFSLFRAPYSSSSVVSAYALPNSVIYATSSLAVGTTLDVTFSQISGAPSTSTSITLESIALRATTTISLGQTGLITR